MAPAHAKINLSLEVVGRRSDGYHELVSVMQAVSLHDELTASTDDDLHLECDQPDLAGDGNLVLRAARLLHKTYDLQAGARLELRKIIPVAAGLGGGSSDAAAALIALDDLWELHLSDDELRLRAAELGSDVPFFLVGGTALAEGRGERVTPLPDPPTTWYVLSKPASGLSTAEVFGAVRSSDYSSGQVTHSLADGIRSGGSAHLGVNSLQDAALRLSADAYNCFEQLSTLVDGRVLLSGSGPTSIGWVDGPRHAEDTADAMRALGYWSAAVRSMRRGAATT
jgi:4-diphosphocytidyl-2-C-methyl-D-erythritol kinase